MGRTGRSGQARTAVERSDTRGRSGSGKVGHGRGRQKREGVNRASWYGEK